MGRGAGVHPRRCDEYQRKVADGDEDAEPVKRDLRLETLAGVLKGEILVHQHCYRADEMAIILDMAKEFGYHVSAFHHGVEAYKIANLLAEQGVCGALWADWWGFKMESYDGIPENLALVDAAPNGCAIVHSDSSEGIQRLNQEAAKAVHLRPARRTRDPAGTLRSSGSRPTRHARSASWRRPGRSRAARTPTSSSGTGIPSASTHTPSSC